MNITIILTPEQAKAVVDGLTLLTDIPTTDSATVRAVVHQINTQTTKE